MPELDGLEATRRICSRWPTTSTEEKRPRIVAITGQASDEDKKLCREAGMDDCIMKPIQLEKLAAVLNAIPSAKDVNVTT